MTTGNKAATISIKDNGDAVIIKGNSQVDIHADGSIAVPAVLRPYMRGLANIVADVRCAAD